MKRKTVLKILASIICIFLLISVTNPVMAAQGGNGDFNFKQFDGTTNKELDATTKNAMGMILNVIRTVGTGIALIMLSYVGIKYMLSSPDERAEHKNMVIGFIVGAFFLFAASNIVALIVDFAQKNVN